MSLRGCGLLGFVNSEGLGPDPKGRVQSPKDFKPGRTGFSMHAGTLAVAALWRMGWPWEWRWGGGGGQG